jgi:hypothetical protein
MIRSIKNQESLDTNNFEIILIGPSNINVKSICNKYKSDINIKHIIFEESIRPGWVTLKKNLLVQNAEFDNICLTHDYVGFCEKWYMGYEKFGYDWDVCMNPIRMTNGLRHRDWFSQHRPLQFLKYDDDTKTNEMYINGTYWCGKKKFMLDHPQNNNLAWGMGEDCEWANRCQRLWKYRLNPFSVVKYLKEKGIGDWNPHPNIDPNKNADYISCNVQL